MRIWKTIVFSKSVPLGQHKSVFRFACSGTFIPKERRYQRPPTDRRTCRLRNYLCLHRIETLRLNLSSSSTIALKKYASLRNGNARSFSSRRKRADRLAVTPGRPCLTSGRDNRGSFGGKEHLNNPSLCVIFVVLSAINKAICCVSPCLFYGRGNKAPLEARRRRPISASPVVRLARGEARAIPRIYGNFLFSSFKGKRLESLFGTAEDPTVQPAGHAYQWPPGPPDLAGLSVPDPHNRVSILKP